MEDHQSGKRLPVKEGLYTSIESGGEPLLIASRCPSCGEYYFPKRRFCQQCQHEGLDDVRLRGRGKVFSYTSVMQRPGRYYKGVVPYTFGWVELPEGIRIETLFTDCDAETLKIGLDVEMIIGSLFEDENGNQVVCHMFTPVRHGA